MERICDQVKVCNLCQEKFNTWVKFRMEHIDGKPGIIGKAKWHKERELHSLFKVHVLQCRVVAHSLGEPLLYKKYEVHNRSTRDVEQVAAVRNFQERALHV